MRDERGTNVKLGKYQCGENEIPGRAESEVRGRSEEKNDSEKR